MQRACRRLSSSSSASAPALARLKDVLGRQPASLQSDAVIDYLRKSKLARSELDASDIEIIADLVASNPNVESIDVSSNGFGAKGAAALGRMVQSCASLRHLASGRNNLRTGVAELAATIADNTTLQRLELPANAVNAATCAAVGASLRSNSGLLEFDLSWNPFGPGGGEGMAALLGANTTLQRLNLAGCAIRAEGTCAVAAALEAAPGSALRELDLSENFVGREGALALAALLARTPRLEVLLLGGNGPLDREGCAALAAGVAANSSLRVLGMQSNGLDEEAKVSLGAAKAASDGLRAAPLMLVL